MQEITEWYQAIRPRILSVLIAAGGVAAVFGFDITPAAQAGLVEGLDGVVASLVAAYAAVNVLIARGLVAVKADEDIETGPTTPGPTSEVDV